LKIAPEIGGDFLSKNENLRRGKYIKIQKSSRLEIRFLMKNEAKRLYFIFN